LRSQGSHARRTSQIAEFYCIHSSDIAICRTAAARFAGSADDFASNRWRSAVMFSGSGSVSMCANRDASSGAMALMTGWRPGARWILTAFCTARDWATILNKIVTNLSR
jgi:hypothetical protein